MYVHKGSRKNVTRSLKGSDSSEGYCTQKLFCKYRFFKDEITNEPGGGVVMNISGRITQQ